MNCLQASVNWLRRELRLMARELQIENLRCGKSKKEIATRTKSARNDRVLKLKFLPVG